MITGISQSGYVRQPIDALPQRYLRSSLPPLEFAYSAVPTPEELARQPIRELTGDELENLPHGLDGLWHRFVDLDGEGLLGLLSEHAGEWLYKRNLSPLDERALVAGGATFAAQERLASLPAAALGGTAHQLLDLAGDGQLEFVDFDRSVPGFDRRTADAGWSPFQPFTSMPTLDWRDPNMRFVDLTGDGIADILVTEDEVLSWFPGLGEAGFAAGRKVDSLDAGPRLVFADATESPYLADMSGDGLADLVRVRNGEVCYWPNLGYGRFGARVSMDDAPWFDPPDLFDQRRVRLADVDGSGVVDIVYLGRSGAAVYYNGAGNGWSGAIALPQFPRVDSFASVHLIDLFGERHRMPGLVVIARR